ncbi:hypothetical protein FBULB1_10064 [Fusarium bulbicola]|nr:hypothetical protein FBULB1_10064 [Fusarium bulbicola]
MTPGVCDYLRLQALESLRNLYGHNLQPIGDSDEPTCIMESPSSPSPPAGVTELYNSSPAKIQPWIQANGSIPGRSQKNTCGGPPDPTHGIAKGDWLIMGNNPAGVQTKDDEV